MVSSNYYNYGSNYGAYQTQGGGSMLGSNTSMSGTNSSVPLTSASASVNNITNGSSAAMKPQQKEGGGGIGGFFKGIVNGAKNLVKGIADPKNWPLIIGAVALTAVCPPAGLAMAAVGGVMGGAKMVKGMASGNMEEAGEGFFDVGTSVIGGAAAKGASAAKAGAIAKTGSTVAKVGSTASKFKLTSPSTWWPAAKGAAHSAKTKVSGWFGKGVDKTDDVKALKVVDKTDDLSTVKGTPGKIDNSSTAQAKRAARQQKKTTSTDDGLDVDGASMRRLFDDGTVNVNNTTKNGLWARGRGYAQEAGKQAKGAGQQLKNEAVAFKQGPKQYVKDWWGAKSPHAADKAAWATKNGKDVNNLTMMDKAKFKMGDYWGRTKGYVTANPVQTIGAGVLQTNPFRGGEQGGGGLFG